MFILVSTDSRHLKAPLRVAFSSTQLHPPFLIPNSQFGAKDATYRLILPHQNCPYNSKQECKKSRHRNEVLKDHIKSEGLLVDGMQEEPDAQENHEYFEKLTGDRSQLFHVGSELDVEVHHIFGDVEHIPGMVGQKADGGHIDNLFAHRTAPFIGCHQRNQVFPVSLI